MHGIRITEWLNANCSRSFPLVVPGDLPLDLLVDCRLCFFKEQPAAVALYAMSLVGSVASVTMDVAGHLYTVTSTIIPASLYNRIYSDTVHGSLELTLGPGFAALSTWSGSLQLEPACILFAQPTRHMGASDDIPIDPANPHSVMEGDYAQAHSGTYLDTPYAVDGDVKLEGGYGIQVAVVGNTVTLSAVAGYGDLPGYPCFQVHSAGPRCLDKIFRLNGVTPDSFGKIDAIAGSGMRIGADASGNLLIRSDLSPTQPWCRKA